jgi:CelD/BcsL family acetyltransferase involved in cellulose biosynthesis
MVDHRGEPLTATILDELDPPRIDEWRNLAVLAENPFVLPEWHGAWLQTHPKTHPVLIAAHRRDGSLAGVVPLVTGGRRGRWLSAAGGPYADWFSPACAPDDQAGVATAAASAVDRLRKPWRLDRCVADEAWLPALRRALEGRPWRVLPGADVDVLSVMNLEDGSGPRRKAASEIRRRWRRLESSGATIRLSTTPEEAVHDFDAALALHARRWGESHFDAPARAFQREFARRAAERGWLRLWMLEVGGKTLAFSYGWRLGSCELGYLQGFADAYAGHGPGVAVMDHAVRKAREAGCLRFNMLRGAEGHKRIFGPSERALLSVAVVSGHSPAVLTIQGRAHGSRIWRRLPEAPRERLRGLLRRG